MAFKNSYTMILHTLMKKELENKQVNVDDHMMSDLIKLNQQTAKAHYKLASLDSLQDAQKTIEQNIKKLTSESAAQTAQQFGGLKRELQDISLTKQNIGKDYTEIKNMQIQLQQLLKQPNRPESTKQIKELLQNLDNKTKTFHKNAEQFNKKCISLEKDFNKLHKETDKKLYSSPSSNVPSSLLQNK